METFPQGSFLCDNSLWCQVDTQNQPVQLSWCCPVSPWSCSVGSSGPAPSHAPAVHRWGICWGGPAPSPESAWYLSWSDLPSSSPILIPPPGGGAGSPAPIPPGPALQLCLVKGWGQFHHTVQVGVWQALPSAAGNEELSKLWHPNHSRASSPTGYRWWDWGIEVPAHPCHQASSTVLASPPEVLWPVRDGASCPELCSQWSVGKVLYSPRTFIWSQAAEKTSLMTSSGDLWLRHQLWVKPLCIGCP